MDALAKMHITAVVGLDFFASALARASAAAPAVLGGREGAALRAAYDVDAGGAQVLPAQNSEETYM